MNPSTRLFNKTYENKIPVFCTFELTRQCNLRCVHCYVDLKKTSARELTTAQVKNILTQLARAGTLNLIFTGGEPLLREDIFELCCHARNLKFDLRLFTNGLLLTDKMARRLSSLHLSRIELSLYGREETHDAVTRKPGSFKKVMASMQLLKKYRIPATVKCPLMTMNFKDYPWLQSFAKKNRIRLQMDPAITPKTSGNDTNLRYRLSEKQLTQLYSDASVLPSSFLCEPSAIDAPDLLCSAGHNLFAIGYNGDVFPCLQIPLSIGNLKKQSFTTLWKGKNKRLSAYRNIQTTELLECMDCASREWCQRCPGLALIEDNDIKGPSKIACQIAKVVEKSKRIGVTKRTKASL